MIEDIRIKLNKHVPKLLDVKKETAIMIPLIEIDGQINVIFERRSKHVKQPRDISFAGGHKEENESFEETAIRETCEELGVEKSKIKVLGKLCSFFAVTGMYSETYVGLIETDVKDLKIEELEVESLITIPLETLLKINPKQYPSDIIVHKCEDFPYHLIENGKNYPFYTGKDISYFYIYNDVVIWGYTAKLLYNFLELIKKDESKF